MDASQIAALQASQASSSSQQVTQKPEQTLGSSSTLMMDLAIPEARLGGDQRTGDEQAGSGDSPRNVHGLAWTLVVVATISTMFLFGLDQTITADVQPAIISRFNEIEKLPPAPAAQDSMTILSTSTTAKERPLYMSIPGLAWGSSTVLGPVIGGAFTISSAGWRWGFYINLFIGAACLPVYIFLVPSKDPRPELPWKSLQRIRSVDVVGFILLLGIFVSLLMGINFGGLIYPWDSGSVIALFVVAGVLVVIFVIQQTWILGTTLEARSFPLQFLVSAIQANQVMVGKANVWQRNPTMMVNFFNQTASATSCFLPIYFIPLYFQFVRGDSALEAAVRLLPYMAFLVTTVIVEGFIMSNLHSGKFMPWFYLGGALVLVGSALMYTVDAATSNARIYGYSILLGSGTGAYLQMPFAVAQAQVSNALVPMAVAFTAFAQLAAPAITLSIANSIFLNEASRGLLAIIPGASPNMVRELLSRAGNDHLASLGPIIHGQVLGAIVGAMSKIYILVIVSGALTLVLTVVLTLRGLRRKTIAGAATEKELTNDNSA
ncbi:MAG: hypothetical protein Q9225_005658 [Loekoesia sp. 1 TL-2023]